MTDSELPDGPFEVVISVEEPHRDAVQDVASRLQDAGLEGAVVLAEAGVVTGGVPHAEAFHALKGVAGVERRRSRAKSSCRRQTRRSNRS